MQLKTTQIHQHKASYYTISDQGMPAHFYGANGFPTLTYTPLLEGLSSKFALKSLALRACWEGLKSPSAPVKWKTYADDLIPFIEEQYTTPIVGIGHSQGATATLIAASLRPDLFKELILIEPASVTPKIELMMKILPLFVKKRLKPMNSTLHKKEHWNTTEEYYQFMRGNNGYKRMDDNVLFDIAQNSLDLHNNLVFPAKWEAYNYSYPINLNRYFKDLQVPVTVIAGKPSLFLSKEIRENWLQINPTINFKEFTDYGHLLPLESPETVLEGIKK